MSQDGAEYARLCEDLAAEECDLDAIVSSLAPSSWETPTPAVGWDVRDQIGHLAVSEDLATLAATDAEAFRAELLRLLSDLDATEDGQLARGRGMEPPEVLAWWRASRERTLAAVRGREPSSRILWAAGEMSATSFVRARLMETWAHGQDIVDAVGVDRLPTARLRHIAELGVRTRGFSYANRGLPVPGGGVRVELRAPDGSQWTWGEDVGSRVMGPAIDFCLVVTRRRRPDATALRVEGSLAAEWMDIAQAFAGLPS